MKSEFEKYVTVLDFSSAEVMTYPINVGVKIICHERKRL